MGLLEDYIRRQRERGTWADALERARLGERIHLENLDKEREYKEREQEGIEMMLNKKWERKGKVSKASGAEGIEIRLNEMIQQLFRDLMYLNYSAEGDTLKIEIKEKESSYEIGMSCRIRQATSRSYFPINIFRNGKNTTVKWEDGTVTTVKRAEETPDDVYNAFTAALAIKILGTNSAIKREIRMKTVDQKKKEKKSNADP